MTASPPAAALSAPKTPVSLPVRCGLWLLLLAPVAPNLIGSAVNIWYNAVHTEPTLADTPGLRAAFQTSVAAYNLTVYPLSVALWAACVLSLRRVHRQLLSGRAPDAAELRRAQRRVINLPWLGAGIAAAGWLLCAPLVLMGMRLIAGPYPVHLTWHYFISIIIAGLVALTHGFFIIELVAIWLVYPVLFHSARPAETPGAVKLSLRARGLLWAVSASVCPIVSLCLLAFAPGATRREMQHFELAVGAIGIVFGLVTAWLVGRLVAEPIGALRQAADRLAEGDLSAHVSLLRADEFGTLIDAFNQMVAELREKERLRETFGLHVGHQAARQILARDPGLGGIEREITVMFMDVRGFTARCARCSPEEVVRLLNVLLTEMVETIEKHHGGMVNKFLGDGLMALFGASGESGHADAAVNAGREMLFRLDGVNASVAAGSDEPLQIGIGIHTGPAIVGSIGSASRLEYTAIGDTVNIAARVEGLTKKMNRPLLVTESTRRAATAEIVWEEFPPQAVKGQPHPVRVFSTAGIDPG